MQPYSPHPILSSMRGTFALGQDGSTVAQVPTAVLEFVSKIAALGAEDESTFPFPRAVRQFIVTVDPRSSNAAMKGYLAVWAAWADSQEKIIQRWATTIDSLIQLKAVTCAELERYNKAALIHWAREVQMATLLIKAGASESEVPMPFFPLVFASEVRFVEKGPEGRPLILHRIPCAKGAKFPDFSKLRVFGPPESVASALTPAGQSLAGLGANVIRLLFWARPIIMRGLLVIGGAIVFDNLRQIITKSDVEAQKNAMLQTELGGDAARDAAKEQCVKQAIAASQTPLSPEQHLQIVERCAKVAEGIFPVRKGQEIGEGSLGLGILLGGLGIAAAVASIAYFRRR